MGIENWTRRDFMGSIGGAVVAAGIKKNVFAESARQLVAPDFMAQATLSRRFLQSVVERKGEQVYPYFFISFDQKPGSLKHYYWDWSENLGRLLYGDIFAQRILGTEFDLSLATLVKNTIYSTMHEDGLSYYPATFPCRIDRRLWKTADLWSNRSIFVGLTQLWITTRDEEVRKRLDTMVNTLNRYAIKGPGRQESYFAVDGILPGYVPTPIANPYVGQNIGGWLVPLFDYYEDTKNLKALDLALALATFVVNHHKQHPPISAAGPGLDIANVHAALYSIAGVVESVRYSGNKEHLAWARSRYEYARENLVTQYGWVAEHEEAIPRLYPTGTTISTEGCAIVDMVHLAIRLAHAGYPDAWNLVERFARNFMQEGQLSHADLLRGHTSPLITFCETNEGMPERVVGSFVGWGAPADFLNPHGRVGLAVQNCCGCHYPFGLHLIWENIVTRESDGVHVNMAFNRKTPWCTVISRLPAEGHIEIAMHAEGDLFVRIPDWVDKERVQLHVADRKKRPLWSGDFIHCANLLSGTMITLTYPLRRVRETEHVKGHIVDVEWVGDTVRSVRPGGQIIPLFN